jgi:hypothetical protein
MTNRSLEKGRTLLLSQATRGARKRRLDSLGISLSRHAGGNEKSRLRQLWLASRGGAAYRGERSLPDDGLGLEVADVHAPLLGALVRVVICA